MEDTQVHALDYLSVLRRRKWWLIAPILVSVGAEGLTRFGETPGATTATVALDLYCFGR